MGMSENMIYPINYPMEITYQALIGALTKTTKYQVVNAVPNMYTLMVKTGMSFTSWGENITIAVTPGLNGNSNVTISSSLKMGLFDWGKNNHNIVKIIELLTEELTLYGPPNQPTQ